MNEIVVRGLGEAMYKAPQGFVLQAQFERHKLSLVVDEDGESGFPSSDSQLRKYVLFFLSKINAGKGEK